MHTVYMNINIYTCISLVQIDCSNNVCQFVMLALCTCHQQCHVQTLLLVHVCVLLHSLLQAAATTPRKREDEANALVMVVAGSRSSLSLSPERSEPRCVDSPITEERRNRENAEFAARFQATKEK